jgi:hypothetical protein
MSIFKRIFIGSVMMMTVLSMSVVVAPQAKAAASAGDLIKISGLSSVYYLGANGKRYVFPNEATYFSWYKDFSGVVTIPQSEMEGYPLAANVVVRPGTKLIKSPSINTVYAVEPNGTLRSIVSEANATNLWGANWNKKVIDVIDSFFVNYTVGTPLTVGKYPIGQLIKTSGSADIMLLAADGTARKFASEAAFTANNYNFDYVATVPSTYVMPSTGTAISGVETSLTNVAQSGVATGPVASGSGLTVALASDTPASQTIPAGVSRIELLKFNVTAANDGDVVLSSITINRSGLGSKADFTSVWLEQNGVRLTSTKTINTTDQAILSLSPTLTISAGKTVTLSVFGAIAGSSLGANDMLSIVSASNISASSASISGSFPISGNLMSFTTGYTVNQATIAAAGSNTTLNVGDEGATLASFSIADSAGVGSSGTRDLVLKSITLKNDDNAELATVASNLALTKSGVKVSESATVSGKNVTFVLANGGLTITKGDTVTLKVTGDIIYEDASNNSVQLKLNKASDMDIEEATTGYAATVTTNATTGAFAVATATFYTYALTEGSITITKEASSPTSKSYVKNTKDVVALLANLKSASAFNADGMVLDLVTPTSTVGSFSNVRLYVNGGLVDSKDLTNGDESITYDSSVTINQGNNEIKVVLDINNDATDGANITVKLLGNTGSANRAFTSPVYVANDVAVTYSDIGGSATAGKITVAVASLTATRSDGFSAGKDIVRGTPGVVLGNFTLKALNDAVTINSISLSSNNGALDESQVSDLKLLIGGAQVGPTKNMGTSGTDFNLGSDAFTIAKDATKVVQLIGTVSSGATIAAVSLGTTLTFTGVDSNGKDLATNPTASTVLFDIVGFGTLTVAKDGDTMVAALLPANSSSNEVAKFKFTATNDDLKIDKIYISNMASTSADSRISAVNLYNGSTLLGTATPSNGEVSFDLSTNPVSIAASKNVVLTAKLALNDITEAAQSGLHVQLTVTGVKAESSSGTELDNTANALAYDDTASFDIVTSKSATASSSDNFVTVTTGSGLAVGDIVLAGSEQMLVTKVVSATVFEMTRGINGTAEEEQSAAQIYKVASIPANDFIVRKTIPTISLVALPSTTLTVGDQTVLKFTVSADSNSDVTIQSFMASTTNTGTTFSGTTGSLQVNGANYANAIVTVNSATAGAANKISVDLTGYEIVVSAGTSKTIAVILPVSAVDTTSGATASITAKINQDASTKATTVGVTTFGWSDGSNPTGLTLANSFEVPGLSTATQSMSTN